MASEIRVPTLGESVTEATIAQWYKKPGEPVSMDEPLCELETDKVTIEVPAQSAGVLEEILFEEGATVEVGALLGSIDADGKAAAPAQAQKAASAPKATPAPETPMAAPKPAPTPTQSGALAPSVRRLVSEHGLSPADIVATGKDGRLTKGDVLAAVSGQAPPAQAPAQAPVKAPQTPAAQSVRPASADQSAREERVKMTRLRQTIARRLKESQNTAAQLTTFNEVDMSALMQLRSEYKDLFEKKYGVRLGFMSFFVRACVTALHEIPAVNAEISGDEIIYKNYVNMGIAVGTAKGLVVPVLRDVQEMGLAQIEQTIGDFGQKARDGKLAIEDLQGGTFTVSNGGVYGSLMSTPILNLPQSGVLGMHKIQERPMVVNGQVEVRPMMYLALSYDHRIVDGKEAVTFLVRVKESLEAPERLLLDI